MTLPYYPKNWPGGEDRIASWKSHFESRGIRYTVLWAWEDWELVHYQKALNNGNYVKVYFLYFKLLFRRSLQFLELRNYKTIWVQRAYIPVFPYKHARFEKLLKLLKYNWIIDFYDADYESNYNLVMESVSYASGVTVASKYLYDKYKNFNSNVHFLRFAIDTQNFLPTPTKVNNIVKIGWMGSPGNARNLVLMQEILSEIERKFDNVIFSFVCRDLPKLNLSKFEKHSWGNFDFNYYKWLSEVDIGIVPFMETTERTKAKIAMKSLEFMAYGIPMVCSMYVHSDKLVHNESFLLAHDINDWYLHIERLVTDPIFRLKIGNSAKDVFMKHHSKLITFNELYFVLVENG